MVEGWGAGLLGLREEGGGAGGLDPWVWGRVGAGRPREAKCLYTGFTSLSWVAGVN